MSISSCIDCWDDPCTCHGSAMSAAFVLQEFGYGAIVVKDRGSWKQKCLVFDIDRLKNDLQKLHDNQKVEC